MYLFFFLFFMGKFIIYTKYTIDTINKFEGKNQENDVGIFVYRYIVYKL